MPKTNLKFYVDFPNWDDLTDPQKSVINFFMKDASMVFRGDYQDGVFQYQSGNIRNKYYSIYDDRNTFDNYECSLELNIGYTDLDVSSISGTNTVDGFPDWDDSVVVTRNSLFSLMWIYESSSYIEDFGFLPLSVTITPKAGDIVINTPRLRPKNIDTNYNHIVTIPIETAYTDFEYGFQLRSSSFYIDDGRGNIDADVFYKIGICPVGKYNFDTSEEEELTLEECIDLIKNDNLSIKVADFLYYSLTNNFTAVGNSDYKFTPLFIFPVFYEIENAGYECLLYLELYNQDGTLFTQDLHGVNLQFYCRPAEDEEPVQISLSSSRGLKLIITDQSLDRGFVLTPIPINETFVVFTEPFSTDNI